MLNSDSSRIRDICNPCNWMGHALLIIETVEEGDYFSRQADLIKDMSSKEHYGEVRLFELSKDSTRAYAKIYAKSETYRRPKEDIQGMINQIYREVTSQRNGKPMVLFQIDAGKPTTLAREAFRALTAVRGFSGLQDILRARDEIEILEKDNPKPYNCIQYSLRNLSLANIEAPLQTGSLLSKMFFPTPVLYVGSKIKATVQEAGMITSYVGLHSLPYLPRIIGAFNANCTGVRQGITAVSTWGLMDVAHAYSAYYSQGHWFLNDLFWGNNTRQEYNYRRQSNNWMSCLLNNMGISRAMYRYQRINSSSVLGRMNGYLDVFTDFVISGPILNQLTRTQRMRFLEQVLRD